MTTLKAHGKQLYSRFLHYVDIWSQKVQNSEAVSKYSKWQQMYGGCVEPFYFIYSFFFFATKYHFVGVNKLNHYSLKCL